MFSLTEMQSAKCRPSPNKIGKSQTKNRKGEAK